MHSTTLAALAWRGERGGDPPAEHMLIRTVGIAARHRGSPRRVAREPPPIRPGHRSVRAGWSSSVSVLVYDPREPTLARGDRAIDLGPAVRRADEPRVSRTAPVSSPRR